MCFAMCANHDMRRSIYEASFVKSGPLGNSITTRPRCQPFTVGSLRGCQAGTAFRVLRRESQDPASIRVDAPAVEHLRRSVC